MTISLGKHPPCASVCLRPLCPLNSHFSQIWFVGSIWSLRMNVNPWQPPTVLILEQSVRTIQFISTELIHYIGQIFLFISTILLDETLVDVCQHCHNAVYIMTVCLHNFLVSISVPAGLGARRFSGSKDTKRRPKRWASSHATVGRVAG